MQAVYDCEAVEMKTEAVAWCVDDGCFNQTK